MMKERQKSTRMNLNVGLLENNVVPLRKRLIIFRMVFSVLLLLDKILENNFLMLLKRNYTIILPIINLLLLAHSQIYKMLFK